MLSGEYIPLKAPTIKGIRNIFSLKAAIIAAFVICGIFIFEKAMFFQTVCFIFVKTYNKWKRQ